MSTPKEIRPGASNEIGIPGNERTQRRTERLRRGVTAYGILHGYTGEFLDMYVTGSLRLGAPWDPTSGADALIRLYSPYARYLTGLEKGNQPIDPKDPHIRILDRRMEEKVEAMTAPFRTEVVTPIDPASREIQKIAREAMNDMDKRAEEFMAELDTGWANEMRSHGFSEERIQESIARRRKRKESQE